MTAPQIEPGQGALFGDLDGLFAPELVPCTPPDQVRLALPPSACECCGMPLTECECLGPKDDGPGTRAERVDADRAERLADIAHEHDEFPPADPSVALVDLADCPGYVESADGPWCHLCGWEEHEHDAPEPDVPDPAGLLNDPAALDTSSAAVIRERLTAKTERAERAYRGPDLDPARCPAWSGWFGAVGQCTKTPGHRTPDDPHDYERAEDDGTPDQRAEWAPGITWSTGLDHTPPVSPDGRCLAYVENRDDREENGRHYGSDPDSWTQHDLPEAQRGAYAFRGACVCGWRGPVIENDHAEERAYFDAADHAHPGWRELPPLRAPGNEPSKKRAAAYAADLAAVIPEGWTGPVRQHREHACGHAWHGGWSSDRGAVPGRAGGRVEICACPCHMTDNPDGWHAEHADAPAPADVASATPALF